MCWASYHYQIIIFLQMYRDLIHERVLIYNGGDHQIIGVKWVKISMIVTILMFKAMVILNLIMRQEN